MENFGKRKKRFKKRTVIFSVILVLVCATGIYGYHAFHTNPRLRLFASVLRFMAVTLDDPGYLLNDIDIMELCRDYGNADTEITGKVGLTGLSEVKSSIYMDIDAKRSFSQKKFASEVDMDFLWFDMGQLLFYAEGGTVYLDAPMLGGDIGYAFPTGDELFHKMPDLTHDIDREWFQENMGNIITFLGQIAIDETGETITTDDGQTADEFVITIPQGSGQFIWDLLGMDAPDYDVVCSMYLTGKNVTVRMTADLSHSMEGASMQIDGASLGTAYFFRELPDDERVEFCMVRNASASHRFDCTMTYFANTGKEYEMTSYLSWEEEDDGFSLHVKDIAVTCDGESLAGGYFSGEVKKTKDLPDLFGDQAERLYGFEVIDWKYVRDDSESFIKEVLAKTSYASLIGD